ncbi:hypothetical protein VNO78_03943 [Psophocarpus tetragonolobus]|uniref:Uncharacterized protein n=1 Tax=Psophocarpus tetragonolobus TaxID=3891 RepID=A0AAN9T3Y7_PSOTE
MARLILFLVLFASLCSCLEGRKLHLGAHKHSNSNKVDPFLLFSSLPKGTVPSSTPSRKGHSTVVQDKLIARHLITTQRLLLRSVPSPVLLNTDFHDLYSISTVVFHLVASQKRQETKKRVLIKMCCSLLFVKLDGEHRLVSFAIMGYWRDGSWSWILEPLLEMKLKMLESTEPLMVECELPYHLWQSCYAWWGQQIVMPRKETMYFDQFVGGCPSYNMRKIWHMVFVEA